MWMYLERFKGKAEFSRIQNSKGCGIAFWCTTGNDEYIPYTRFLKEIDEAIDYFYISEISDNKLKVLNIGSILISFFIINLFFIHFTLYSYSFNTFIEKAEIYTVSSIYQI